LVSDNAQFQNPKNQKDLASKKENG
jgi:hypothetical protein